MTGLGEGLEEIVPVHVVGEESRAIEVPEEPLQLFRFFRRLDIASQLSGN